MYLTVIHVAEPRRLLLVRVGQAAGPVDVVIELSRLDELLHTVESKVVGGARAASEINHTLVGKAASESEVVPVELGIGLLDQHDPHLLVLGRERFKHVDLVVQVEHSEVHGLNELGLDVHTLHLVVHAVGPDHLVSHPDEEGLHRVALVVVVVADVVVVEEAHSRLAHNALVPL